MITFVSSKLEKYRWVYGSVTKIMEKLLFEQFHVSTPSPLLTMLRNNEQNLRQTVLWLRNIV